ncbi:unnamed protein product, partial [Oppiella nova]
MLVLLFVLIVVFLYYNAQLMDKLTAALKKTSVEHKNCDCPEEECNGNCSQALAYNEKTPLLSPPNGLQRPLSIQYAPGYKEMSYEILNTSLETT